MTDASELHDEALARLREVLAELPDPTWRQLAAMWIADAYWRLREAVQRLRMYP